MPFIANLPLDLWMRRRVFRGAVVVFVALLTAYRVFGQTPEKIQEPPAPVVAERVEQRDVVIQQTFVGTVTPTRTSVVGSPVEGQVVSFLVREGDFVKKGEKLAQLRLRKLEIQLAAAQSQLELLKSQLEDLRISLPIEIEQAKARKQAAEALKLYASEQYKRARDLLNSSPITPAELDELKSAAESTTNVLGERAAAIQLTEQTGPVKIAQAQSRIKVQEEAINELKDAIDQHTIVAPFDGYISQEQTEVGQWITKGGAVAEIVELTEVEIVLPVMETYIGELCVRSEDQPGTLTKEITVDALPNEQFQGEIVAIVPKADYQARTFPVKVRVVNRVNPLTNTVMLKPGMFARVVLPVRTVRDAVLVPKDSLVLDRRSPSIWQIVSPREAASAAGSAILSLGVEIEPDVSVGDWIQLIGPRTPDGRLPLKAGDMVITEGNERVRADSRVIITSGASSE